MVPERDTPFACLGSTKGMHGRRLHEFIVNYLWSQPYADKFNTPDPSHTLSAGNMKPHGVRRVLYKPSSLGRRLVYEMDITDGNTVYIVGLRPVCWDCQTSAKAGLYPLLVVPRHVVKCNSSLKHGLLLRLFKPNHWMMISFALVLFNFLKSLKRWYLMSLPSWNWIACSLTHNTPWVKNRLNRRTLVEDQDWV